MVQEGKFRKDLYFRRNVVNLHVHPFCERLEVIPDLPRHFLKIISQSMHKPFQLQDGAMDMLMQHQLPGNVR